MIDGATRMRWIYLQHVPFEGPAFLARWSRQRGFALTCTRLWTNAALPAPVEFDGLFILGGPMNVYEDAKYSWLAPEKEFIAQAISDRKPILGVCLGAQLLAVVLGGIVTEMLHKEIGWCPVELTPAGRDAAQLHGFPDQFMAFHWHGDSFAIPPGAIHVARSDACETQAFSYRNHVVGLQFHLEADKSSIAAMLQHCGDRIRCGPYTQDRYQIEDGAGHLSSAQLLVTKLLDNLSLCAESHRSSV